MKLLQLNKFTEQEEPRSNYKRLSDGGHLCRTQAAYRDAVKRFCASDDVDLEYPTNYPKAYPCVVYLFSRSWGAGVSCSWLSLDDYKDKLLAQFREVQGD